MRLTSPWYFSVEDDGVMTISLECDHPANISFIVTLQLTPQTALLGIINMSCNVQQPTSILNGSRYGF